MKSLVKVQDGTGSRRNLLMRMEMEFGIMMVLLSARLMLQIIGLRIVQTFIHHVILIIMIVMMIVVVMPL